MTGRIKTLIFLFFIFIAGILTAQNDSIIWVDDFEDGILEDWNGRHENFEEIYQLSDKDSNIVLAASSIHSDNFLIKKFKVDLVEYPYLNWRWKAKTLPENGDESKKKTCDVAASVYVILKLSKWRPRSIKYSWSTTIIEKTFTKSPFAIWPSRSDIIVLQSGDKNLDTWQTEKVNVLNHYQRLYRKKKVKKMIIEGISIMTDSDNTGSLSEAEYDDIYFSKQ